MSAQTIPHLHGRKIRGTVRPPSDKSITHRSIIIAALSKSASVIRNPLLSGDCLSTINCFRKLGVKIKISKSELSVSASTGENGTYRTFRKPRGSLDCGNSGTTMRLLSGIMAAQPFTSRLTGDHSLSSRPMKRVIAPLMQMGAKISARNQQFAPLKVTGNPHLKHINWKSPVASAQVKSCVLLAGLFAGGKTTYQEPYRSRDHSERMLKSVGANIQDSVKTVSDPQSCHLRRRPACRTAHLSSGDSSSAAFLPQPF